MRHQARDIAGQVAYARYVVDRSVGIRVFSWFSLFIHISEEDLLVSLQFWNSLLVNVIASFVVGYRNV